MTKRINWRCPCGTLLHLQPSRAKTRTCCSHRCPAHPRRVGGLAAAANRVRRVMLAYGLTEAEARVWLDGWLHGRQAAWMAQQRGEVATRARVGTEAWERQDDAPRRQKEASA